MTQTIEIAFKNNISVGFLDSDVHIFIFLANQYKVEIWHSGGPPATESVSTQGQVYVTFVNHDGKNETIEITR